MKRTETPLREQLTFQSVCASTSFLMNRDLASSSDAVERYDQSDGPHLTQHRTSPVFAPTTVPIFRSVELPRVVAFFEEREK